LLLYGVAASPRIFLSLANATVQHIYFFSQPQKPLHKKIKELHSQHTKPQKSRHTAEAILT
jgi:hypothetical protein